MHKSMRELCYINVIDDINSKNIEEIRDICKKSVKYITEEFMLPSNDEFADMFGVMDNIKVNDKHYIMEQVRHILSGTSKEACEIICESMGTELDKLAANETIKRNAYSKVVYWLKKMFIDILDKPSTIVIYKAPMGKYEMFTMYILSKLGINVVIITKDIQKLKLSLYKNILLQEYHTNENLNIEDEKKKTTSYDIKSIAELKEYIKVSNEIPSICLTGCSEDKIVELNNFLVWLNKEIDNTTLLFKHEIPKPTSEEARSIPRPEVTNLIGVVHTLASKLSKTSTNRSIVSEAICAEMTLEFKNETNITKVYSRCVTVICWANKYLLSNRDMPKSVIVYGEIDKSTNSFIQILKRLSINTMLICTDKSKLKCADIETLDLGESLALFQYPTGEIREKQATIAYNASQEINSILFNGSTLGLYRERQFSTCKCITLSTTYEEVAIYWHQETKFRPHFKVEDNIVTVPNFFIKISGCSSNYQRYLDEIARLVDDNTIVYYDTGFIDTTNPNMFINHGASVNGIPFKEQVKLISNHRINPDIIMGYKNYNYGFISQDTQLHMLSKIQELLDCKCIEYSRMTEEAFEDLVLNVTLNLNKETLRLIQWFDFTQHTPKIVVLSQSEKIVSLEDTIYLTYLSLMGFDIAVVVPTCYNSIERYIPSNMYQEHIIGQPKFDTHINNLKIRPESVSSWFGKLFNR